MAMGSFDSSRRSGAMAEINVVPLVDVMLVLLVIFIITAPLLTHAVKIDLPKAAAEPNVTRVEHVELAIRADGILHWNGEALSADAVGARMAAAAQQQPQPELHIRADRLAAYEHVARALARAARSGLTRIGFVSDPAMTDGGT